MANALVPTKPVVPDSLRFGLLYDILSFKRQADSFGELAIIKKYLVNIPNITRDFYGNYYVRIGTAPVMWSCHTDTVHLMDVNDKKNIRQKLQIDEDGFISAKSSSCLGADNGVGIWLMLNMLKFGVEGLYVFHRQEEHGGLGSHWIADNQPNLVKDIKFAIAFDRRKTTSVITHQGVRTCSDAFADSLIEALGMEHKKDDGGTFTDTKSYKDIIPECTNISAGFYNEHTYSEYLDTEYAWKLLQALLKLDISKLVCERDPKAKPEYPNWYSKYLYNTRGYDDEDWGDYWTTGYYSPTRSILRENPSLVYEILEEWGVAETLANEISARLIIS